MTFVPPVPEHMVDVLDSTDYPLIFDEISQGLKPSNVLKKTYIAKEGTGLNIAGSTNELSLVSSKIIFTPVQYVTDKTVNVHARVMYEIKYDGTIGGMAQNHLIVKLGGIVASGSYVFLDSFNATISTDNLGYPMTCCVEYNDMLHSHNILIYTVNHDPNSTQQIRQFKLYITADVSLLNTELVGWGQLFPV